jgi:hypothetical protein
MATGVEELLAIRDRTWSAGQQVLLDSEPAVVSWVNPAPTAGFFWVGFTRGTTQISGIHIDNTGKDNKGRQRVELPERSSSTRTVGLDSDRVDGLQDGAVAPGQGEGMTAQAAEVRERAISVVTAQLDEALDRLRDAFGNMEGRLQPILRNADSEIAPSDLTMKAVSENSDLYNTIHRQVGQARDVCIWIERLTARIDL